jgi:hypothetical protein
MILLARFGQAGRYRQRSDHNREPGQRLVAGPPARDTSSGGRDREAQASFVMAMTIPISTNTTIAICIQIQVGDIDAPQPISAPAPLGGTGPRRPVTHGRTTQ